MDVEQMDLTPDQIEELERQAEEQRQEQQAAMDRLGQSLSSKKDKCVEHKADVEARWLRDERQYWGVNWNRSSESTNGDLNEDDDYQVTDNKTKAKTRTVAARIGDMLFPTNDANWAMKASPVPEDIDGNPLDPEQAEDAASRAEQKITDHLTECNYAKSGRKAIFDGCRLGTGVLKGPFSKGVTRRQVRRSQQEVIDPQTGQPAMDPMTGEPITEPGEIEIKIVSETKPAVARTDPWMWFPAAARNVEECEFAFELHLHTKDNLRDLARYPGFDEDQLRRLLDKEPDHGRERGLLSNRRDLLRSNNEALDNTYTVWEYHGPLEKSELEELGIEGMSDDPLESVRAEVWFCQGIVLKIELAAMADDHRIPYYVWCYEEDEADIFGYGVPYSMRDEQMMLDSILNAMKLNAELTAGPQTVEFKGKVTPADGKHRIKGPKHWIAEDPEMQDFREAIQFHYVESSIASQMPLYELASNNADQNTMLPMLAQGEATNAHPTSSGIAMLMNASNIVQRMAAHSWDDNITIPMITRFFYWLVQYDDDDSIKLDLEVDPRGASYLLVKDQQAQHGMMLLQMAGQDPELRAELDMRETYETVVNFLDVPTDRLFKTKEQRQQEAEGEQQQAQLQQQHMRLELQKLQAEAQKAQAEAEKLMREAQGGDQGMDSELQAKQLDHQARMSELETKLIIAQMERDSRLAQAAGEQQIKLVDLQAKLQTSEQDKALKAQIEQMRLAQKEMAEQRRAQQQGMEARLKMQDAALKEREFDQRARNMDAGYDTY